MLTRKRSRYAIMTPKAVSIAQWSTRRKASEVMITVIPTCAV